MEPEKPENAGSNHEAVAADSLANQAVALAAELLAAANAQQTHAERTQAQRIARLMEDPAGKELTIALVDQAFRSHNPARVARTTMPPPSRRMMA